MAKSGTTFITYGKGPGERKRSNLDRGSRLEMSLMANPLVWRLALGAESNASASRRKRERTGRHQSNLSPNWKAQNLFFKGESQTVYCIERCKSLSLPSLLGLRCTGTYSQVLWAFTERWDLPGSLLGRALSASTIRGQTK